MKIRSDFVTNSSSTNFIIISKNEINEECLVDLFGFERESPFAHLIREFISEITYKVQLADYYFEDSYYKETFRNLGEFIKDSFSKNTYEKFLKASEQKEYVYLGSFSSDEDKFSGFFCTDPILIEGDNIYFDATISGW